jgi:cell division protein FtsI/penicillin-binding protein 2
MSIGYEIGVSALQMATSFATIANNGVRVRPHIIREIRQSDQTKVFEAQPESDRVVSRETAQNMRKLMRAVVTDGTGKRAELNGYTSAGNRNRVEFDEKTKRVSGSNMFRRSSDLRLMIQP